METMVMDEMWAFLDVDDEHENMAPQQSKQIEAESDPQNRASCAQHKHKLELLLLFNLTMSS